jgi:outer membrane protein assembly factor BamA
VPACFVGLALSVSVSATPLPEQMHAAHDSLKKQLRSKTLVQHDSSGYYLKINRIFVLGNKKTRERIILRELTLKPGDSVYNLNVPKLLERDERKIFNLHLFNSVELRILESEPGKADLLVEVDERWFTFPVPIFQLSDRNFNEWWENYNHNFNRVNYGLKLYQYNMRGRNETLTLTAQFGFVRRYELMYRIPYFDPRQKQGLIFQLDYIEAKNLPYRTEDHKLVFLETDKVLRNTHGFGVTYTYRNSFYKHHRFGYSFRETNITDSLLRANPNYLGPETLTQRYDIFSYEFISDHRDVVAYPLTGHNFLFHLQKVGFAFTNDLEKLDAWTSYAHYLDLKKGFYLSNFSFAYWSNKSDIPYYNYGAMGYNKIFVRGYEVNVIEGPRYLLNKTTLKKRIFSRVYSLNGLRFKEFKYIPLSVFLKTYADFGYIHNYPAYENSIPPVNTSLSNTLIAGTGFGLDIVSSYDMVLRFEYTFNAEGRRGFFFHIKKEF